MTSRLWSRGIGSVSDVVYLQQSNSRRLMVQEIQHKGLGTPDVIGDTWSEREKFSLVILNSLISVISNSGIRAMSTPFRLELIPKFWLWFLIVFICFVVSISWFFLENLWKFWDVLRIDRFLYCLMLWCDFNIFMLSKWFSVLHNYCRTLNNIFRKSMKSLIG
jgi:hypothetical protein